MEALTRYKLRKVAKYGLVAALVAWVLTLFAGDDLSLPLLGAWALKAACVQIRQFEEVAKRDLYISVNISPRQFRNDRFLGVLDDAGDCLHGCRGQGGRLRRGAGAARASACSAAMRPTASSRSSA